MKARDVIIGFIFLVGIVVAILIVKGKEKVTNLPVLSPTPSIEQKLKDKFSNLVIPNDGNQIDLNDVSGSGGMGIATRNEILADLPDLVKGQSYQAYLSNSSGKTVLLGTLRMEKGGWILDYDSSKFPGYNKIIIKQNLTNILEGSF